jgi:hypothetical protein
MFDARSAPAGSAADHGTGLGAVTRALTARLTLLLASGVGWAQLRTSWSERPATSLDLWRSRLCRAVQLRCSTGRDAVCAPPRSVSG